jgi:predicted nucleic acid-binding protein
VSGIVADTSVWIDFFRGDSMPLLEQGLAYGSVVLPPLVVSELVSGATTKVDRAAIGELLQDLEIHQTDLAHWLAVGDLRRTLREAGVVVSTPDAHVAQCAIDRDALLLSRDDVFTAIAGQTTLQLASG